MNPIVRVESVTKKYLDVQALDDVNFEIKSGEVRALVGKNGAGKSTLIRLLTGAEIPNKGKIYIGHDKLLGTGVSRIQMASQRGVASVYQELSLVTSMTVAENMFLGLWPRKGIAINHRKMYRKATEILKDLNFPIDVMQIVSNLSFAEQQMVEIARAMMGTPKLIILDEPTSALSGEAIYLVFNAIRKMLRIGVAVLYVSHRMKEIRAIASTVTVMRDGKIIDTVDANKTSTDEIVRMMLGQTTKYKANIVAREETKEVLSVRKIALPPKLKTVSFELYAGEILGIAGLLGSGRTEILQAIAGLRTVSSGDIFLDGVSINKYSYLKRIDSGIAITPEDRKMEGLFNLLGVDENIVVAEWENVSNLGVISNKKVEKETNKIIGHMSIKTESPKMVIENLSGGNQQKVIIGRLIYAGITILLLDEPTRGVDVEAKAQIYQLVRKLALEENKSVIFVSSEIEEMSLVCDRVLVLRDGCICEEYKAPYIDVEKVMVASINT